MIVFLAISGWVVAIAGITLALGRSRRLSKARSDEETASLELRRARQSIAAHDRASAAFVTQRREVAHDMRNSLSTIMAFASLIEADPQSGLVQGWASKIGLGADALDAHIDALQDLSIGDEAAAPVHLVAVVQSAIETFTKSQTKRPVEAVLDSALEPGRQYLCDERRLESELAAVLSTPAAAAAERISCSLERTADLGDDIDQITLTLVIYTDNVEAEISSTTDGRRAAELVIEMELRRLID